MKQISFIDLFIDLFESALQVSDDKLDHPQIVAVYQSCIYNQNVFLRVGECSKRVEQIQIDQ